MKTIKNSSFFMFCMGILGFLLFPTSAQAATLDCSMATNINVPVVECEALLNLYDNLEGSTWQNKTNWDTDTDVCTWYGISCTNILGRDRVTSINLYNNGDIYVYGPTGPRPLPSSLSNITELQYLNLSHNMLGVGMIGILRITDTLPSSWGNLDKLEYINIAGNQITGSLPESWSGMISLQQLDLRNNSINGELPASWSTLTNLTYINLSNNQISGQLPSSRSSMTGLTGLSLGDEVSSAGHYVDHGNCTARPNNDISGELPASWTALTNIQSINLSCNQLTGGLPLSRSSMINIKNFDITNNNINGNIPSSWSSWTELESLYVGGNQLSDNLDNFLTFPRFENLRQFDGGNNNFYGSLPSDWGSLTNLIYLSLQGNQIESTLPASWSGMTNLITLILSNNLLYGFLPSDWGSWTNISTLDLRQNFLEGYVPHSWTTRWYQTPWVNFSNNCVIVNMFEPPNNSEWPFANSSEQNDLQDGCTADLSIAQIISTTEVAIGSQIEYTIVYNNLRYNPAENPIVTFDPGMSINIITTTHPYTESSGVYYFNIVPNILVGQTGEIVIVSDVLSSQSNNVDSEVSISSQINDPDLTNNQDSTTVIVILGGPNGGGGGSGGGSSGGGPRLVTQRAADNCLNGDFSPSKYDGLCGDQDDYKKIKNMGQRYCHYTDGEFNHYKFLDVVGTKYESTIGLLLDNCLVHGYKNEGRNFGLYNNVKLGEMYKIFVRLSQLDFSLNYPKHHRSYGYELVGQKVGLRKGIDTKRNPESEITMKDLYQVASNYLVYKGFIKNQQKMPSNTNPITRASFSSIVAMLMKLNIK